MSQRVEHPAARSSAAKAEATKAQRSKLTPRGSLRIVETRVYRGPNFWNYDPAIKLIVDLGVLEAFP